MAAAEEYSPERFRELCAKLGAKLGAFFPKKLKEPEGVEFCQLLASAEPAITNTTFEADFVKKHQGHNGLMFDLYEVPKDSTIARLLGELRGKLSPNVWRGFSDIKFSKLTIWAHRTLTDPEAGGDSTSETPSGGNRYKIVRLKPVAMDRWSPYDFGIHIQVLKV